MARGVRLHVNNRFEANLPRVGPPLAAICLLTLTLLSACALFQESPQQKAQDIDSMLAAAGFRMIPADTPKKQNLLQSLTPLKLKYYVSKSGQARYYLADPYDCMCVYRGDEKAYQAYQAMRFEQRIDNEERQAAELNQDAAMQMNMYDPFWF